MRLIKKNMVDNRSEVQVAPAETMDPTVLFIRKYDWGMIYGFESLLMKYLNLYNILMGFVADL